MVTALSKMRAAPPEREPESETRLKPAICGVEPRANPLDVTGRTRERSESAITYPACLTGIESRSQIVPFLAAGSFPDESTREHQRH
jgi:hypothetical protein